MYLFASKCSQGFLRIPVSKNKISITKNFICQTEPSYLRSSWEKILSASENKSCTCHEIKSFAVVARNIKVLLIGNIMCIRKQA